MACKSRTHKTPTGPLPRIKLRFSLASKRAKEERCLKYQKLTAAITDAREGYLREVDSLAEEFERWAWQTYNRNIISNNGNIFSTKMWMWWKLYLGGRLAKQKWAVSIWNAFLSAEIWSHNECKHRYFPDAVLVYNNLKGTGQRLRLHEYLVESHSELKKKYKKLTPADKSKLLQDLVGLHVQKVCIVCSSPKSIQQDVDMAFNIMQEEVCTCRILLYHDCADEYAVDIALSAHRHPGILCHHAWQYRRLQWAKSLFQWCHNEVHSWCPQHRATALSFEAWSLEHYWLGRYRFSYTSNN